METNYLTSLANEPEEILTQGLTDNAPVLNLELMKRLASERLDDLKSLPAADLTTENGRKTLKKSVAPIKADFAGFEKNIKVLKKIYSDIPKKCDAVSKALRDMSEPAIDKALAPLKELEEQEKLTQKWWKKEGIPTDKYSLESGLKTLELIEPSIYSNEEEKAEFNKQKTTYLDEWKKCLERIYTAEKAEREEREHQAKEAERLRLQAEEQRRVAEAQRKEAEALEAEKRRIAEAAAEIERQKQAAINPEATLKILENSKAGAPPAIPEDVRKAIRRAAVECLTKHIASLGFGDETAGKIALSLCMAIHAGTINNVRFYYE